MISKVTKFKGRHLVSLLVLGGLLYPGDLLLLLHGLPRVLHGRLRSPAVALRRQTKTSFYCKGGHATAPSTVERRTHSAFAQKVPGDAVLPHFLGRLGGLGKLAALLGVATLPGTLGGPKLRLLLLRVWKVCWGHVIACFPIPTHQKLPLQ